MLSSPNVPWSSCLASSPPPFPMTVVSTLYFVLMLLPCALSPPVSAFPLSFFLHRLVLSWYCLVVLPRLLCATLPFLSWFEFLLTLHGPVVWTWERRPTFGHWNTGRAGELLIHEKNSSSMIIFWEYSF